jgi:hypothetical protein
MNKLLAVTGALLGCALILPSARGATFDDFGSYFSFHLGDGGLPADIPSSTGRTSAPDGQSFKMFGDCGPIPGDRFETNFVLDWSGGVTGPISPGDKFSVDLTFDVTVTGGTLAWNYYSNLWSNEGFEQARILTDLTPIPASGQVSGVHLESTAFTVPGDSGYFEGYLHIDWSGFAPTDTFSIHIPENSIDVTYLPAPEPASLALTVTGLTFLLARRRPRGIRSSDK